MTESQARKWIGALLVGGVVLRVVVTVLEPSSGDLEHFRRTADAFRHLGLEAYGVLNVFDPENPFDYRSYSYPPGFVPWLLFADAFEGQGFAIAAKIPPILADLALAWLIQSSLRRRGASPKARIGAVALVMGGPVFLSVSAVTGQLDGVAFLPAVAAVLLWDRGASERRAVAAGLLIGLGGLVKAVPLLLLFALLPTTKTVKERVLLVTCAVCPLVFVVSPFFFADPGGVFGSLAYSGFPGGGGLGVLVQPELARHYLTDYSFPLSAVGRALQDGGIVITIAAFAFVAWLVQRRRSPAPEAALVLGLTLVVFAINFYEQYLLWFLPFALICLRLWFALAVQLVMFPYLLIAGTLPAGWLDRLDPPRPISLFIASIFLLVTTLALVWAREVYRLTRSPLPGSS